ncbi:MAG: PKD domain-containing protein [Bacteroidetes bacterium]|nr:PKD domain-containing protein [Bacteroidota bacterium]
MNQLHRKISLLFTALFLGTIASFAQVTANFTADITQDCPPAIVQFTSTSSGNPTTYAWDFGDGTGGSILQNPSHTFAVSGLYTVTLTASNASFSDSEIKVDYIRVFVPPTAGYSLSNDSICAGTSVTFVNTSIPGDGAVNQFSWTFNDGSPQETGVSTVNHVFTNGGTGVQTYFPNLAINDANGCNGGISDTIWVFPQPVADFFVNQITSCSAPATISFTNSSSATSIYNWNFGDPSSGIDNTSTDVNPSHTFNATGTYTIVLTSGIPGCDSTHSQTVTIAQPQADFSISDTVVCFQDTIRFTNTGTVGSFNWNFSDPASGGNNSSGLPNPVHVFSGPGTYNVQLIVSIGFCQDTIVKSVRVRIPPQVSFISPDHIACDTPFTVSFNDTISSHNSWSWIFGDPSSGAADSSILQNPSHTYHSFGYFPVTLAVTDAFGCRSTATFAAYVQIVKPVIDFTRPDSGSVGSTFTFNANVVSPADPTITDYTWVFTDGTGPHSSGNVPSISHTFNTVGIFPVTLTITTSSGCTVTLTKPAYIKIGTKPNANFSATPLSICFKENVQFTDLSAPPPITGWRWDFGDGGSSTAQNPNHQYNIDTSGTADPFDVTLIVFYNGCPDTIVQNNLITVLGPIPDFSTVYNCASPYTVSFTNLTGGATSYSWDFGDGSAPSTAFAPNHTYADNINYTVVLTATSSVSGCTIDTVHTVQIRAPRAVAASSTIEACHPAPIQFTGSGSEDANTQQWTFGEGIAGVRDTSVYLDTLHLYNTTGYYTATLTITDIHNCTSVDTQRVHIIGPTSYFYASPFTGCAPLNVNFTDTSDTEGSSIVQWVWNYGSVIDTTSTGASSNSYPTPGTYSVTLTTTDANGCTNSNTATNYIVPTKPSPTFTTTADTLCRNSPLTFTGSAGPYVANPVTYNWNFGDGNTSSGTNAVVSHSYTSNGSYSVQLIARDDNNCVDSIRKDIFVYTTPASFHWVLQDTCVEVNGIKQAQVYAVFTSDSNDYMGTYSWDLEYTQNLNTNLSSYVNYYSVPAGSYDVALSVTNQFGCVDSIRVPDLVVVPGPTGSFTVVPDSGCRPLTVTFNGVATNANLYAWDFGDGNVIPSTSEDTVSHTYTGVDNYLPQMYLGFTMPISGAFCYVQVPNLDTIEVTSLVSVDILEDTIIVRDEEFDTLHVQTTGPSGQTYTYAWNPSSLVNGDPLSTSTFYATTTGTTQQYTVNVGYGSSGCSGSDSVLVIYLVCEASLKIPNVFTPNNDTKNDTYHVDDLCNFADFYFKIFNRWGKIVFESNDPDFAWDGLDTNGTECSEGTYYYVMHTRRNELHGFIQLIRE